MNPLLVLLDGPFDGFRDVRAERGELPELVTVAWCDGCKRRHVHAVTDPEARADCPLYLLNADDVLEPIYHPDGRRVFRYLHQDLDEGLDQLLAAALEPRLAA